MSSQAPLARWGQAVVDFLFPAHCLGCGSYGHFLCSSCQASLPRVQPPICPRCGRPQPPGSLCPDCREGRYIGLDGIRSPFLMEGLVREAIHRFKYDNLRALAQPLGELLGIYLEAQPLPAQAIVPVPIHPSRLRQRGHNQAALLARVLGRRAGLPVAEGSLARLHPSPPQAQAPSARERWANVQDAFQCRDRRLEGIRVLLVDDVCTTGATLEACAAALKWAGATSVWGLTLAREA